MLSAQELGEILNTKIYPLNFSSAVEALFYIDREGLYGVGKEKTYQTGTSVIETYEFCTEIPIEIPEGFRVEQCSHFPNTCSYIITRRNTEMFKEWKFCYERY